MKWSGYASFFIILLGSAGLLWFLHPLTSDDRVEMSADRRRDLIIQERRTRRAAGMEP